ncbi:MAG: 50S ribosomal protein L32 [Oscillospiraceae bacterium]|nr:50S ribosomal protein L32 [Oscillospiraceae bacterium]
MAVPKGKVSRARRDKRRSSHWKLAVPGLVKCPKCGALRQSHRMCPECGTYNGRTVKVVEAKTQAE